MEPVLLDPDLFIAHLGSFYSPFFLSFLAICVPVTVGLKDHKSAN